MYHSLAACKKPYICYHLICHFLCQSARTLTPPGGFKVVADHWIWNLNDRLSVTGNLNIWQAENRIKKILIDY